MVLPPLSGLTEAELEKATGANLWEQKVNPNNR
jgi:hypothetical protein